jgi:lysophospholipase L1-like esterase
MTRLRSCFLALGLAGCAVLDAACSPTLPSKTTVIPPPAITCPVAPSPVTTGNGQSAVVSYSAPAVTGGTAPLSVTCTPPSGSTFSVGSTTVTCLATDAVRRTAGCSFAVSVIIPPPRLGVRTILAFGDSITEGEVPVAGEFGVFRVRPRFVEPDHAYPAALTTLLGQRYTTQGASRIDAPCTNDPPSPITSGILVINAGCLGEHAGDPATFSRLYDKIVAYRPDVLLLLEGINDLSAGATIAGSVQGVQRLTSLARGFGMPVLVGTLPPEIAGDVHAGSARLIVPFNSQLVPAAASAGANVVDLYSDLVTDVTDWISPYDGLHPTGAGYQEMARVWFTSIKNLFELPSTSTATKVGDQVRPGSALRGKSRQSAGTECSARRSGGSSRGWATVNVPSVACSR